MNSIKLPLFNSVEERINYVNEYLPSIEKCNEEYGERVLNCLAAYIVQCEEFSIKPYLKRRKEVLAIKQLDKREEKVLNDINSKIIYIKSYPKRSIHKDVIFIVNKKEEKHIKENIDKFLLLENKGYTESFIYNDLIKRQKTCRESRELCRKCKEQINRNYIEVEKIKKAIQEEYKIMKESKDKSRINMIIKLSRQMKELIEGICYLEKQIRELYDAYYQATELVYKVQ